MTAIRVHLETGDGTVPVGTAHVDRLRGVTTTRFTYDDDFRSGPGWSVSPDLPIARRGDVVTEGLPGALDDSAPDLWGRNLITRHLASQARAGGHVAPAPTEVDFLLGVADRTRQGALRCSLGDGPFLAESSEVPRLVHLESLLDASRAVAEEGADARGAVQVLLDAGSGSLGGARPKASVTDGDRLFIAKFPQPQDRWEVMRWEAVALALAAAAGIATPANRLLTVGADAVLLVERFDRDVARRIPFLSARSLVGPRSVAGGDYLEVAEALTEHGSDVTADLVELWRRLAFSIAVNNTDDHLRNHAVLRDRGGWALSPAFDLNPDPDLAAARATSIAGAVGPHECHTALFASVAHFDLDPTEAAAIWGAILHAVAGWRAVADACGIPEAEHQRFAPVLDRWTVRGGGD